MSQKVINSTNSPLVPRATTLEFIKVFSVKLNYRCPGLKDFVVIDGMVKDSGTKIGSLNGYYVVAGKWFSEQADSKINNAFNESSCINLYGCWYAAKKFAKEYMKKVETNSFSPSFNLRRDSKLDFYRNFLP